MRKGMMIVCAVAAMVGTSNAGARPSPKAGQSAIKLQCSGTLNDWQRKIADQRVSGVYVEIRNEAATIYNVAGFDNYQSGISLNVYKKNPASIFMRSNDMTTAAMINRMSGEISLWQYYSSYEEKGPARRAFVGSCVNPKPVF